MVDERQSRARGDARQDSLDDVLRARNWKWHVGTDHRGAPAGCDKFERVAAGVVGVIGREQLVTGSETQRAQDSVDAGSSVWHEREVLGIDAEEAGQPFEGGIEQGGQATAQELDRLGFHALPPDILRRQHGTWTRSVGAVIEERHRWVERPGIPERGFVHSAR